MPFTEKSRASGPKLPLQAMACCPFSILTVNFYIFHIIILYAAKYCNRKNGLQPKLYRPNLPPRHRRKVPRATPSFSPRPCRQAAITPSQFLPRFLDLRPKWTPLALPPQSLPPAAGAEIPALFAPHGAEGNVANQSARECGCPAEACPGLRKIGAGDCSPAPPCSKPLRPWGLTQASPGGPAR